MRHSAPPDDAVDLSSAESFPASDPPSWIPVNGSTRGLPPVPRADRDSHRAAAVEASRRQAALQPATTSGE